MRQFVAYHLIFLLLASWAGGIRSCYEVTWEVRLLHRMDAREAAIARELDQRLRDGNLVRVIDPAAAGLRGGFYSGDFVFTDARDRDTAYFLLVDETKAVSYEQAYRANGDAPDREAPAVTLNDFFKPYLSTPPILSAGVSDEPPPRLYSSTGFYSNPIITIPEPPPNGLS